MQTIIEKANYVGYVWMSDSKTPIIYYGKEPVELTLNDDDNPFVIEGNLWDPEKRESVKIAFVDGKYLIRKVIVSEDELNGIDDRTLDSENSSGKLVATTRKEFYAHRLPRVEKLLFLQYWESVKDPACEGMEVLSPSKLVFVGFNNKED